MKPTFHAGEIEAQKRANQAGLASRTVAIVKDSIPEAAFGFIECQHLVVVCTMDYSGSLWTSILMGNPGFAQATDDKNLQIDIPAILTSGQDPFWSNIEANSSIGMLFIDLALRRRLRVNGTVHANGETLRVVVKQAYANCPQYIQRRVISGRASESALFSMKTGTSLSPGLAAQIRSADTFFVGSSDDRRNLDASHRGGNPGFVQLDGLDLKIPDYSGNGMFNTLGNFLANPRAGLLFVDFEHVRTLQLTGKAYVFWEGTEAKKEIGKSQRVWNFQIDRWIQLDLPKGLSWNLIGS